MSYKTLKYLGNAGWAFTYICFIAIAYNYHWSMIPLVICAYNISYEFLYTILATDKGQRFRNGIWFSLDIFIIYNYIVNIGLWQWSMFLISIMMMVQIVLNWKISKEITKSFAWFVTLLMAILILYNSPPFYSNWVVAALIGKILGDGFYGIAHLMYGVPGVNKNSLYQYLLKWTIISSFAFNLIVLFHYINQFC